MSARLSHCCSTPLDHSPHLRYSHLGKPTYFIIMVTPDRPPRNELNRRARKIYNAIGFSRFYNFVLCL